jgi:hypothetical protein
LVNGEEVTCLERGEGKKLRVMCTSNGVDVFGCNEGMDVSCKKTRILNMPKQKSGITSKKNKKDFI